VLRLGRYTQIPIVPLMLVLLCLPLWARAQAPAAAPGNPDRHHGQGYLFLAPGAYTGYSETRATMHVGAGGEALLYKGFGAGAEIGGIWALQGSDLLAVFSADGSYHFSRGRKISPFLTGGYSLIWGDGSANMVNFGGGINWWLGERKGVRLEFRDHVYAEGSNRQIVEFRIGFAFR
jgi:hypothetical protein